MSDSKTEAMDNEGKHPNETVSPEQLRALLAIQNVSYEPPLDASIVSTRTQKVYNMQPLSYSMGQTMLAILNSGGDFINGMGSYLMFDVSAQSSNTLGQLSWAKTNASPFPDGTSAATYTTGSACNILKYCRLTHRSGDLLEYVNNLNALIQARLNFDNFIYENYGEMFGAGKRSQGLVAAAPFNITAVNTPVVQSYCIPMLLIYGLFSTNKLMPPQLAAALKLEIGLANIAEAFVSVGIDPAHLTVNVNNVRIVLDSLDLFDSVKRVLMEESIDVKKSGLQFPFKTYFNDQTSTSGSGLSFNIQKSASKTIMALSIARRTADLANIGEDSVCCSPDTSWRNVRWRLGSNYMPQDPIRSATVNGAAGALSPQQYIITQQAFENAQFCGSCYEQQADGLITRYNNKGGPLMAYTTYCGKPFPNSVPNVAPNLRYAVIAQSLENNTILGLSGSPVNNSRLLTLEAELINIDGGSNNQGLQISTWLQYESVANCMADNLVLDV